MSRRPARRAAPPAPPVHRIAEELLTDAVRILVVGCGGTGSEVLSGLVYLHQAMRAWGHPWGIEVLAMDADVVSESNTVRQPFSSADVGHPKATLLVNRLNAFWGLDWRAVPRHLTRDELRKVGADIVIGCVDSRAARATIWQWVTHDRQQGGRVQYYLDLGNDAASGQFVLGVPPGFARDAGLAEGMTPERLPCAPELFPELIDVAGDAGDDRPSCSAAEALERQEPFINRAIAAQALAMLTRLFRHGSLSYHGGFLNLATGRVTALEVNPETWARMTAPAPKPKRAPRAMRARRVA